MLVNNIQYSYLKNGAWNAFSGTSETAMDGIKIQTPKSSPYFLRYRTWNSGKSDWYSRVDSNVNDYAGAPNRPIQRLQIQVYGTDGTKITEKIVVMYRARVAGRWLPWVSNAEPEWMQSVHAKYNLGGTIDTNSYYAGNAGQNMDGIEIRVYEEGMLGDYTGGEVGASALQYMFGSLDNWQSFDNSFYAEQIDGIKIQTAANKGYYLQYRTKNEGKTDWYPFVKSTGTAYNDYAGYPGKAVQLLEIQAYKNDGTRLRSGVIVMYRVSIEGRWLPWVSNADPEWMRDMQSKHSLGGTLSVNSTYAGNAGQKIDGVEIRIFEDDTENAGSGGSVGTFPGTESGASLQYMTDSLSNWTSFGGTVLADRIDGIKIRTDTDKPYYLSYRSWNAGKSNYYPYVDSRGTAYNDYAGYPGKPIQLLNIYAYANDGTKLREGVVVMYRVHVDNRWLPWVSNANPDWMVSVQEKYDLGGTLDTKSTYAGNKGQNINGVEIHIFEENGTGGGTITPVGKYKIIQNVPFIQQRPKFPTGCESVSTVMALNYAGVNISTETFVELYLDKKLSGVPFDPDLHFGGDPRGEGKDGNYGCYSLAILTALGKFVDTNKWKYSGFRDKPLSELCSEYIDKNIPVILWATTAMQRPTRIRNWSYKGKSIQWISPMHCLLLIGYDETHYIFNDPLQMGAPTYYSKESVEQAYSIMHKQAIVIQKTSASAVPVYQYGAVEQPVTKVIYPISLIKNTSSLPSDFKEEINHLEKKPTILQDRTFNAAKFFSGLTFSNPVNKTGGQSVGGNMVALGIGVTVAFVESWEGTYIDVHYYTNSIGDRKAVIQCGNTEICKKFKNWVNFDQPKSLKSVHGLLQGDNALTDALWKIKVENTAKSLYAMATGKTADDSCTYDLEATFNHQRENDRYQSQIFFGSNGKIYEYATIYSNEKIEVVVKKYGDEIERIDILPTLNEVTELSEDKAALFDLNTI
ncbi:MAG: C39 family peptidase [Lachnospiraceae bacterium]